MRNFDLASPRRIVSILFFLVLSLLFPLDRASAKKIMVIAAHPDDEALMAAGVIRTAILNGDQVNVVIMTNGDATGLSTGLTREGETVSAMGVLGVNENNVIFLGYPDGSLSPLFRGPTTLVTSANAGVSSTYGNRGLGRVDYHFYVYGVHGPYKGQTVLQDLMTLFQNFAPDEIYTHNYYDAHQDHKHTNLFIVKALIQLKQQGSSYAPILYENIVHDQNSTTCSTTWPPYTDITQVFPAPTCLYSTQPIPPQRWSDITSFNVPPEMQNPNLAQNLKYLAFNKYVSQANGVPWSAYIKKNEWFWARDVGHNIAPLAQVTVSSESIYQLGVNAVDGALAGDTVDTIIDPIDSTKEWRAGTPNNGEWIKLTWTNPQTVSQVVLYDRRDLSNNILAGTLSFSDGSTVAVGALPTNGSSQVINFAPKTISWVMFTITSKAGYYTGLSEIEVYGTSTQPQNHPPQITSGPTAQPGTINSFQTSQVSVTATDPDNDFLTYSWSATGGTITGTGSTVTFQPAVSNTQVVYTISVTVSDSRGGTAAGSTTVTANPTTLTSNIASLATVQVSSENVNSGQLGIKAIDGVVDGYPNNLTKEWVTLGQLAGAWIQLNWSAPQSLGKIVLHDRVNATDNIYSGTLSFSDGSSIAVGALPPDGTGLTVLFAARTVSWVRFTVNSAGGNNTGLAEIEVYGVTNPTPSTVTIVATAPNAAEAGLVPGVFTVTRTGGDTTQSLTVNYTVSGTATNGQDYQSLTGSVVIQAGQSSATITVTPIDDFLVEGPETVILTLTPSSSYTVGSPNSATVTIADDDVLPTVTIVATDPNAAEAGLDPGVFTVSRTGNTSLALTVNYGISGTATNGQDYQSLSGSVVIQAGQPSATITVTPIDDFLVEGPETVIVTLSPNSSYIVGSPNSATVTIADDDVIPTVTIVATDPNAAEAGLDPGVFTVTRTGSTAQSLTVSYTITGTAINGQDYQSLSGNVVIQAGQSSAAITVTPIDDNLIESSETVIATVNSSSLYTVGSPNSAIVTIGDNDVLSAPVISLTFDGLLRDRVGQNNLLHVSDGQLDGVFTVTYTANGPRTLTQLKLTNSVGGVWDTVGTTGFWTLGVASGLDTPLLNGSDDSVNFTINNGDSFKIFGSDFQNKEFLARIAFSLTATFSDGTTATVNFTLPVSISLTFDGKLRDRVGQNNLARSDSQSDGTFTVALNPGSGNSTVTQLKLTNSIGGVWDTVGTTGFWTLGVASGLDTPLLNGSDDSVNFGLNDGGSFKIFASDLNNTEFLSGRVFTLTASFVDGTTTTANVTVP